MHTICEHISGLQEITGIAALYGCTLVILWKRFGLPRGRKPYACGAVRVYAQADAEFPAARQRSWKKVSTTVLLVWMAKVYPLLKLATGVALSAHVFAPVRMAGW